MTSTLAQKRTFWPARRGPSQNWRPIAHRFPEGGTWRSNSTGPPSTTWSAPASMARSAVGVGCGAGTALRLAGSHSGSSSRCSTGVAWKRSAGVTGSPVSSDWCGRAGLYSRPPSSNLGRGARLAAVQRLVRPVGVVFAHPVIDGGLSRQHGHEWAGVVEQFAPQRLMEPLDLPGRGRRARLREPVRDPVAPADLVEQHLPAAREAGGELDAVIAEDLLRRPIARQRLREGQTHGTAGRPLDHPSQHAITRVVIQTGHDPRLAHLARAG